MIEIPDAKKNDVVVGRESGVELKIEVVLLKGVILDDHVVETEIAGKFFYNINP